MTEMECVVTGKVQGVGFRDYVVGAAAACQVCGWVQNQTDGTVRVCAQGMPDNIKEFIEYLHEGSVTAEVVDVRVEWRSADEVYDDFLMLR